MGAFGHAVGKPIGVRRRGLASFARQPHRYDVGGDSLSYGGSDGTDDWRLLFAPQCLRALEQANHVRLARAQLKRRVKAGGLAAAEVVLTSPWQTRTMSVGELLMSQRGWGRVRTRRLLLSLAVPENKQIATLTERQRLAIAAVLTARTTRRPPQSRLRVRYQMMFPS